jgi:hypothetical protein
MDVIFSDQPVEVRHPSIFLAGPTPRSPHVSSWRPEALDLLRGLGFAGAVLVPERRDRSVTFDYLDWLYATLTERARSDLVSRDEGGGSSGRLSREGGR